MKAAESDIDTASTSRALGMRSVCKTYQAESGADVPALADVSVAVDEGEFVTLIGPTGCGKTTLLNIIAGMLRADSGTVQLAGGLRLGANLACVSQHYTLFPWRNVLRNVTFGLEMRRAKRSERNDVARELLAEVGLSQFGEAYPYELSGGMRQRAAIAQALAIEPRLLLMDEPFGAVDDHTRGELQRMLIRLWQERGITVLFVTHNLDEAVLMGGRVLVFSERPGRIVHELEVDLPRPRDRLSAAFIQLVLRIRQTLRAGHGTFEA